MPDEVPDEVSSGRCSASVAAQHCTPGDDEHWLACPACDMVFEISGLRDGQTARCSRCDEFLSTFKADALERVAAFSTAALILFANACAFPFMQFKKSGLESTMTLPQTVSELWLNHRPDLAFIVALFIMVIPVFVLALHLLLSWQLLTGRSTASAARCATLIFRLQRWSMVEVFLVGVLVSLVKISHLATIVLGISFWSYAAFTMLFVAAVTNLDCFQCWRRIEAIQRS